jgi:hypothetical protein
VNVVFLDIDGVLNSERFCRVLDDRHRALGHHEKCECYRLERQIDDEAVTRLNRLVAATASVIVISSSWRTLMDLDELRRVLYSHGLVAGIIGATPDGPNDPAFAAQGPYDRIRRGHEIDYWLGQHPEADRFVILDDSSDMDKHENRLVQTDWEEGLLDEHVDLAIRLMSWRGSIDALPVECVND